MLFVADPYVIQKEQEIVLEVIPNFLDKPGNQQPYKPSSFPPSVSLALCVCKDESGIFVCLFILSIYPFSLIQKNWSPAAFCRCQHVDLMIDLEFWSAFPVGLDV